MKSNHPSWFEIKTKAEHYFGSVKALADTLAIAPASIKKYYQKSPSNRREIIEAISKKDKENPYIANLQKQRVKGGKIKVVRQIRKTGCTQQRWNMREMGWAKVRLALQKHLEGKPHGEMARIARYVGVANSQIHRWSCPVCEHNQEPSFTLGLAVMFYLAWYNQGPILDTDSYANN